MSQSAAPEVLKDKLLYMELPVDPPGDVLNLYADHRRARETHPIHVVEGRFGPDGPKVVFLYRHEDVATMLKDNETFSSAPIHESTSPFMGEFVLVGIDEPQHARYRSLVAPAFAPRLLVRWEKNLIGAIADSLLDDLFPRGKADLVADFAFSYPSQVIARIFGVPQDNFAQFQQWASDIIGGTADPEAGIAAAQALRAYLAPFVAERRTAPQDDFISAVVHAELNGDRLSDEEIYSFLCLLLPAGIETTFRSLGSLLFNLLHHPDQLEALRRDRSLVPAAVEEGLRYEPPIQSPPRIATRDTELRGVAIPAGSIVVPLIGSANHDPALNDNPDSFEIRRSKIRQVTFGNGVHTCLGLHLAKMELRVALDRVIERLPGLRLDTEAAIACNAHIRGKVLRSPTALPAIWDV